MSSLCRSFVQIGHETSRDLRHAFASGLQYGEETLTESNLLKLKRRHPRTIAIQSFKKHEEVINGADWEWWFVSRQDMTGFPIRVQAKKQQRNTHEFGRLLEHQAPKAPMSQIDALIEHAQQDEMVPLHCFYLNEQTLVSPGSTFLSQFKASGTKHEFGCWTALSVEIKKAQRKSLNGLKSMIVPWHILVCPDTASDAQTLTLPMRVRAALRHLQPSEQNEPSDNLFPAVVRLPSYVLELLDKGALARSQDYQGRARGVVVISEEQEVER